MRQGEGIDQQPGSGWWSETTEERFDRRTLATMNLALDRVCENVPYGEDHVVRKRVAEQIIKCATSGKTALGELTDAGQRALISLGCAANSKSRPRWTSPFDGG
ncbi:MULTISPECIES: hypothetical protein [Bradyrhizobium]|jgi:hypothetical protein|uniref:hypothetical protein n=1 Tax=Bradyrhizobium TaxID=374 RepID=UPI00281590C9|nr:MULTISPECIES: hypothetical protein [Bradyrhizobium]MCP1761709.1 hypothetical protein [Bradyrhizobium japonicum]MCP1793289.1 hypothetical protein [Bradyrhizobium japonicum]MCP1805722.1 hypothetical protein [Bradyrhizobium japonicum]MCP1814739.1 hypothetical protein [Bradyrhizobium japonicum]MCP1873832.1 hypothetical protein [Bradyrhizobium japonicum]